MVGRGGEGSGEPLLEGLISHILITGVAISLILEAAGLLLFYHSSGTLAISHGDDVVLRAATFFSLLARLFSVSSPGLALRLMTIGIAVLILTPYSRAVQSVIYFGAARNFTYLCVTLFVLIILTASLLVH